MRTHDWTTALLFVVAVVGCRPSEVDIGGGDDPLAALAVPHRSERYTTTYWTQKSRSDTELWAQAVAFCEDKNDGDHPNCDAVRHVDMLERMSRLPEDRPDSFSLRPSARDRDTTPR